MISNERFESDNVSIDAAFLSDVGKREVNEDSLAVGLKDGTFYAMVADGLGGHGGGDIASETASEIINDNIASLRAMTPRSLDDLYERIDLKIIEKQSEEVKMKTTLALITVRNHRICASHIGDTRIYIFRNGDIDYISRDDSEAYLSAFLGDGTLDDIRKNPNRHILSAALGGGKIRSPDIYTTSLRSKTAVLICSDGFWEYVDEDDMLELLYKTSSSEEWLTEMMKLHNQRATEFCDNFSAICLRTDIIKGGAKCSIKA